MTSIPGTADDDQERVQVCTACNGVNKFGDQFCHQCGKSLATPMLQVNLGTGFSRGAAAHIEFNLIFPGCDGARPSVKVTPPSTLDGDQWDRHPQLCTEQPGHWSFTESFILALGGNPCPPGRYEMRIDVEFPDTSVGSRAMFQWARVPFRVIDSTESAGRELVVDLKDFAILDGNTIDISQFKKVEVKGGGHGIANFDFVNPSQRTAEYRCFQIPLKPNLDLVNLKPPQVSSRFRNQHGRDTAALVFQDGRRTLLFAKNEVRLGRTKRINDIVLRFLPRSSCFDELSRQISGEHAVLKLTETGLLVRNSGMYGTSVNRKPVDQELLLTVHEYSDDPVDLHVAVDPIQIKESLAFELRLFPCVDDSAGPTAIVGPDRWYFDVLGARPSASYRFAQAAGIDAVRLRRKNNLPEEEYVLVFRQALIGRSQGCPIEAGHGVNARILHVARCFWLENLGEASSVSVQEVPLSPHELVPLESGMVLTLGETSARFEEFAQLHL